MAKKSPLAPFLRILQSVPINRRGLLKDLACKLSHPKHGGEWERAVKQFLRTGVCPEPKQEFVIRDHFKDNNDPTKGLLISGVGSKFLNYFHNTVEDGKVIPVSSQTLPHPMNASKIIDWLDGVSCVITNLATIHRTMKAQPQGPKSPAGELFTDGKANIFFVPQRVKNLGGNQYSYTDASGQQQVESVQDSRFLFKIKNQWYVLRAVRVFWGGDGWVVDAFSVEDPLEWGDGSQVFSRKFALRFLRSLRVP